MITIELLGDLSRFGPIPPLDVRSPAEAIRFIGDQIPEFRQFLATTASQAYQVIVDGSDIIGDQIEFPALISVIIQPVVAGAGNLGRIILGVVLLGVSFLIPGGFLGISALTIGQFGVALAIGGIVGLLTPKPPEQKNEASYLLDASGVARSSQGQSVPVLVGQRIIQPIVIGVWIDNENIPVDYTPA